mmetsp:Transcript_11784/g.48994  ORF Transcript_11784/g.48994 Transcript_11784/m.48994 type:complete len:404 (-) Transcript_11784:71-1282(-)
MIRSLGRVALQRDHGGLLTGAVRGLSTGGLKQVLASKIPKMQADVKQIREKHGQKVLGSCTVAQAYGGMRSVKCMTYETSLLDPMEGIRFRGYTIPECQEMLPRAKGGSEPLPESLTWLLLTGDIPTEADIAGLRKDLAKRSKVPDSVTKIINGLPKTMHPMSQLAIGTLALQEDSVMAAEYAKGTPKTMYWNHYLEDTLNIIARLPEVAARIYCNIYRDGKMNPSDPSLDMGANYAMMMGYDNPDFHDLMRLYLVIHSDHEGGNVSAHTVKLVGSALSDPYLSLAAGLNGLAGPLHGLANQEVLKWIKGIKAQLDGAEPTKDNLTKLCWDQLNSGKVIPGYGHAVLRKTDPRYTCQREFALKNLPDDEMFKLVSLLFEVVPAVLNEQGKVCLEAKEARESQR